MNSIARDTFWTPLFALDRLNSWLRADRSDPRERFDSIRSALKPVVYWVKLKAILEASKRWPCKFERVMVPMRCRACGGSGVWHHDMCDADDPGESCRTCEATGTAKLKFVESQIGPIQWHTPSHKWYMSSLDVYVPFPSGYWPELDFKPAVDWKPNTPGRPMARSEVYRDAQVVLAAFRNDFTFSVQFYFYPNTGRSWNKADRWLEKVFQQA